MSSPAAEPGPDALRRARAAGRWIRNVLALLGLVMIAALLWFYVQGRHALQALDPQAGRVLAGFAHRVIEGDISGALSVRLPVPEAVTTEAAVAAMQRRAAARHLAFVPAPPAAEAGKSDPPPLRSFDLCQSATLRELLIGAPRIAALLPCRISLYADGSGRRWLAMPDLDLVIYGGRPLEPMLRQDLLALRDAMLDVMTAGTVGK